MVAGGFNSERVLGEVHIYDPRKDSWIFAGTLGQERGRHTATLLGDGSVLIVGGIDDTPVSEVGFAQLSGNPLTSVEIFFPAGAPVDTVPSITDDG